MPVRAKEETGLGLAGSAARLRNVEPEIESDALLALALLSSGTSLRLCELNDNDSVSIPRAIRLDMACRCSCCIVSILLLFCNQYCWEHSSSYRPRINLCQYRHALSFLFTEKRMWYLMKFIDSDDGLWTSNANYAYMVNVNVVKDNLKAFAVISL